MVSSCAKLMVFGAVALYSAPTQTASSMSDDQIRDLLIGSWIVPRESSDWRPDSGQSVEVFRTDGTYTVIFFKDRSCTMNAGQVKAEWLVKDGILVSKLPDGSMAMDEVLSIANGIMTLHSLDDGQTYTRAKAMSCGEI